MRFRTLKDGMRVFMNPYDYQTMIDCADSRRVEILMRSMGEMGLRIGECCSEYFTMNNIRESTHPDVDIHFLRLYGKDTKARETDGKRRDVWVPETTLDRLEQYQENEGFDDDRKILTKRKRTYQDDIEVTREHAALRENNDDYEFISAHDFRAYFATNMLLRKQVDVEIVMTLGGWEDRQSMDPYLDANFDDIIQRELALSGMLGDDVDVEPTKYEQLQHEIRQLREALENSDLDLEMPNAGPDQKGIQDFS